MSSPDDIRSESEPRPLARGRRTMLFTAGVVAVVGIATVGAVTGATANHLGLFGDDPPVAPYATPSLPLVRPEQLPKGTIPSERVLVEPAPTKEPVPETSLVEGLAPEELGHAVLDSATVDWIDSLQTAVGKDPGFGSVAISEDRATVTITWFGEPSATLREQLDAAPAKIDVAVQPATFRPAELQDLVRRSVGTQLVPGIEVTAGGPRSDSSGLELWILELPAGHRLQDVGHDLAEALGRPDVPITVEVSGPVIPFAGRG